MIHPKTKVLIIEDEGIIAKHIEDILIENDFSSVGIAHDSETALISNYD